VSDNGTVTADTPVTLDNLAVPEQLSPDDLAWFTFLRRQAELATGAFQTSVNYLAQKHRLGPDDQIDEAGVIHRGG
jgi:hypothetical protein